MGGGMRIIVCMKQVIDPEAPARCFKLDSENRKIVAEGVPPVISPYDESALELALKIKDARADTHVSVLSLGPKLARPILMKALAVGADTLRMIEGKAETDSHVTAAILASAISNMSFDLILAGRQAADSNSGGVGLAIAEQLDIPAVSWARRIEIDGDRLVVERVLSDGHEVLRGSMPALVTVSHEAGELRTPKLRDIKKAKERPMENLRLSDLAMDPIPDPLITCMRLESPSRERHCRLIEADEPTKAAAHLARALVNGTLGQGKSIEMSPK